MPFIGKTIFYEFYTEREKQKVPAKKSTGLFFFRGNPGAPFAVVGPGGGFAYVVSLHEGFPRALELSERGYNAFVLKYRVGSELKATEDLAAAISYVFKNAERLGVSVAGYALWGGSAGSRIVGNIALHGTAGFGSWIWAGHGYGCRRLDGARHSVLGETAVAVKLSIKGQ